MDLFRQLSGVFIVLAALVAALWLLRRRGNAAFAFRLPGNRDKANRRMESIETMRLTPQHTLHLVRVCERTLLVASSPAGCNFLGDVADAEAGRATMRGNGL
jgi:flagellar biogenesis protein FliO